MSTFLLGGAAILVLVALGGSGLALLPTPLHRAQAQSFERAHDWVNALAQYQLAGERPPGSHDLARVYDEWGDELEQQRLHQQSSDEYETVTGTFADATAEVQRARTSDARVLYEYGANLVQQGQYQLALREYDKLISLYPASPYAPKAHDDSATAYYALGQQSLNSGECSGALPDYETLVQKYSDTPEGAKAKQELAAPVPVSGQITNQPGIQNGTVVLSRHVTGAIATEPAFFYTDQLSQDYSTHANASGQFTFALE